MALVTGAAIAVRLPATGHRMMPADIDEAAGRHLWVRREGADGIRNGGHGLEINRADLCIRVHSQRTDNAVDRLASFDLAYVQMRAKQAGGASC